MELTVEGLAFHFDTRPVFTDFSVTLSTGITWLRGANGTGKTTLLKLLGGALAPHAGAIRLDDADAVRQPLTYRLRSHFCGGDTPDLPWLTVREFLDLHMSLYPNAQAGILNAQLAAFGMAAALEQAVSTLSLGQHKKLQLALGLALPVSLLLVDEPFNGLDTAAMALLRQELAMRAAEARQCIVLTSHPDPEVPLARVLDLDAS
jgi:ABC-2 type transport system ATP-binding protein